MCMKRQEEQKKIQQRKVNSDVWLRKHLKYMLPEISEQACEKIIPELKNEPNREKRRMLRFLCGRVLVTSVLFVLQLAWFFLMMTALTDRFRWAAVTFRAIALCLSLYIISRKENAVYKISWVFLLAVFPVFGSLMYAIFGSRRPVKLIRNAVSRERKRLMEELLQKEYNDSEIREEWCRQKEAEIYGDMDMITGISRSLYKTSGYPVYTRTDVTYYPLGEDMFRDMLADLNAAKHTIFLEMFLISEGFMWNRVYEILKNKAAQGVEVRMIYDDMGCIISLPKHYDRQLERYGIACKKFNPFQPFFSFRKSDENRSQRHFSGRAFSNRDHRKIVVIDSKVAYTGGANLSDEYVNLTEKFGHWKDTAIRVEGTAAWSFTEMFLELWDGISGKKDELCDYRPMISNDSGSGTDQCVSDTEQADTERRFPVGCRNIFEGKLSKHGGFIQPYGDSPLDTEPVSENLYLNILGQARNYVYMFTPYLVISDEVRRSLILAADRGVDVRIVTPGIPDKPFIYKMTRSNYRALLHGKVKIYEYTPGFLHAKTLVSDDAVAVVGTANADFRSFYLHFECGAALYRNPAVYDVKKDMKETIAVSREIQPGDLNNGCFQCLSEVMLRLFSPLA